MAKRLQQAGDDAYVKVGVLDNAANQSRENGLGNAELAGLHEFGSRDGKIPERSFMRRTVDGKREQIKQLFRRGLKAVAEGGTDADEVLESVGQFAAAEMKKTVTTGPGVSPPNRPSTIARKGSSRPLVDSGRMINSISHQVVKGGG